MQPKHALADKLGDSLWVLNNGPQLRQEITHTFGDTKSGMAFKLIPIRMLTLQDDKLWAKHWCDHHTIMQSPEVTAKEKAGYVRSVKPKIPPLVLKAAMNLVSVNATVVKCPQYSFHGTLSMKISILQN